MPKGVPVRLLCGLLWWGRLRRLIGCTVHRRRRRWGSCLLWVLRRRRILRRLLRRSVHTGVGRGYLLWVLLRWLLGLPIHGRGRRWCLRSLLRGHLRLGHLRRRVPLSCHRRRGRRYGVLGLLGLLCSHSLLVYVGGRLIELIIPPVSGQYVAEKLHLRGDWDGEEGVSGIFSRGLWRKQVGVQLLPSEDVQQGRHTTCRQ